MPKAARKKRILKAGRSTCRKISLCVLFFVCLRCYFSFVCCTRFVMLRFFLLFSGNFYGKLPHVCANANNCSFTFFGNPLEFACTVFRFLFSNKIFPPLFSEADWVYFSKIMTCLKKAFAEDEGTQTRGGYAREEKV